MAVSGYTWIAVEIACLLLDSRLVDPGHWQILRYLRPVVPGYLCFLENEAELRCLSGRHSAGFWQFADDVLS